MRNFLGLFLSLSLLGLLLGWLLASLLPWWYGVPLGVLIGFLAGHRHAFRTLLAGLLAGATVWGGGAWLVRLQTQSEAYVNTVAQVFALGSGGSLLLVTAVLGGILMGLSAWSGCLLRRAFQPAPHRR